MQTMLLNVYASRAGDRLRPDRAQLYLLIRIFPDIPPKAYYKTSFRERMLLYVLGLLAPPRLGLELGLELVPALPPLLGVKFGVHPQTDGRLFALFGPDRMRSSFENAILTNRLSYSLQKE